MSRQCLSVLAASLLAAPAPAQVVYSWTSLAPADFGAPGNWSPPGPPGPADVARFNLTGARAVLSDSRTNVRLVADNATDMEIALGSGASYTTTAAGTLLTDRSFIVGYNSPASLTLRATGSAPSTVNTVNAIVGGVGGGTLALATAAGSGGLQWNNTGNLTVSAQAPGRLGIGAGSRVTVGGETRIGNINAFNNGSVGIGGAGAALTTGTLTVDGLDFLSVDGGGTLTSGATQVGLGGPSPVVTIGPAGTWNLNGNLRVGLSGSINVNGGTLTVAPVTAVSMESNGRMAVTAGGQVKVGNGSGNSFISGTGYASLNVTGTGSTLTADSMIFSQGGAMTIGSGGVITASSYSASSGAVARHQLTISSGGTLVVGSGGIDNLSQVTMAGTLRVAAGNGTFQVAGATIKQTGPALYQADAGATLSLSGVDFQLNNWPATFDGAGTIRVAADPFIGPGGIVKNGSGTLVLSGYSATLNGAIVNAGTLLVTNTGPTSATGYGPVTVNGGTLGGNGRVDGPVTVKAGGAIAPGVGPGTLTAAVDLLLGGTLAWEVGDRLAVFGRLTLDPATSILDVSGGLDGTTTYTVATFTDPAAPGPFARVNGLPSNYFVAYSPTAIRLTPVPEPSALALAGAAAAGWAAWRRRRRTPRPA